MTVATHGHLTSQGKEANTWALAGEKCLRNQIKRPARASTKSARRAKLTQE
jgi:hypothetical protein